MGTFFPEAAKSGDLTTFLVRVFKVLFIQDEQEGLRYVGYHRLLCAWRTRSRAQLAFNIHRARTRLPGHKQHLHRMQ